MKETILTGIRSNDELTLGNYLGAFRPLIDMAKKHADDYQINMFVPDLHSFTTPIDHASFYERTLSNVKMFFAAGLPAEHQNIRVYRQSHVSAHAEFCVILNNLTSFGQASRMVEFKEKKDRLKDEFVSVGLFDYPILMASDILLYDAQYVPVGDDQRQHLELARDIATRFNNKFGDVLIVPKTIKEQAEFFGFRDPVRIMSLQNPDKKMSKSVSDPSGTIMILDDPKEAKKKVLSAVTDSIGTINFDRFKQPGISNLLTILALIRGESQDKTNSQFVGQNQYSPLKTAVAEAVEELLRSIQSSFAGIEDEFVVNKLEVDEVYANDYSQKTLLKVQKAIGLRV